MSLGDTAPAVFIEPLLDKDKPAADAAATQEAENAAKVPPWTWPANTFCFACNSEEALKASSLKIYLIDGGAADRKKNKPGEKPVIIRLGCISFTGDELLEFLTTENSMATIGSFDFRKDLDDPRPQRPPRGSLSLKRGPKGARAEAERTFVVYAAKLKLTDLGVSAATSPGPKMLKRSLNATDQADDDDDEAPMEFAYFMHVYFNDELVGTSQQCVVDEGVDPFWEDAWFQLPVNGQALKDCSLKLELMMHKILPESVENGSSITGSKGGAGSSHVQHGGGSSSLLRGSSSKRLGNEMLKPGEGLSFALATLTLSGNALKAVIGSKLTTKAEKELDPTPPPDKKAKKATKIDAVIEPLKTHQLKSGIIQIGSPGSAVASPLDLIKAGEKNLTEIYNAYINVLDAVEEESKPQVTEEHAATALAEVDPPLSEEAEYTMAADGDGVEGGGDEPGIDQGGAAVAEVVTNVEVQVGSEEGNEGSIKHSGEGDSRAGVQEIGNAAAEEEDA